MARPKHNTSDVEVVIAEAEAHGWTFDYDLKSQRFKGYCGCGEHTHFVAQGKVPWRTSRNLRSQLSCGRR